MLEENAYEPKNFLCSSAMKLYVIAIIQSKTRIWLNLPVNHSRFTHERVLADLVVLRIV